MEDAATEMMHAHRDGPPSLGDVLMNTQPQIMEGLGLRVLEAYADPQGIDGSAVSLENDDLQVRFVRERSAVFMDLKSHAEPREWWDSVWVLEALTGNGHEAEYGRDMQEANRLPELCRLLMDNYDIIARAFEPNEYARTKERILDVIRRRAQRRLIGLSPDG